MLLIDSTAGLAGVPASTVALRLPSRISIGAHRGCLPSPLCLPSGQCFFFVRGAGCGWSDSSLCMAATNKPVAR